MMDDRQLLEAAAKAAGHTNFEYCELSGDEPHLWLRDAEDGSQVWSPLADDGDALRLAQKLGMCLTLYPALAVVFFPLTPTDSWGEKYGDDPMAATRRCIVVAAAAMAKETE